MPLSRLESFKIIIMLSQDKGLWGGVKDLGWCGSRMVILIQVFFIIVFAFRNITIASLILKMVVALSTWIEMELRSLFIIFYSNLWTSNDSLSFSNMIHDLCSDLNIVSDTDSNFQTHPIIMVEVCRTLCSKRTRKSWGFDGLLNFIGLFWHDIGAHFYRLLNIFFYNAPLPRSWG